MGDETKGAKGQVTIYNNKNIKNKEIKPYVYKVNTTKIYKLQLFSSIIKNYHHYNQIKKFLIL